MITKFNPYWIEKHSTLMMGALPIFASCFLVPLFYDKLWLSIPGLALMIGWIALMLYSLYRQRQ